MNIYGHVKSKIIFFVPHERPTLLCLLLTGIAGGIPFMLVVSTLAIWLLEYNFNAQDIGFLSLASFPYVCKFLYAPLIDTVSIPIFTKLPPIKRFGILSLCVLACLFLILACINPTKNLLTTIIIVFMISFFSAIYEVFLDILRIYALKPAFIASGAAAQVVGFRIGMILSGVFAIFLSVIVGWHGAYIFMALFCAAGIWGVLNTSEDHFPKECRSGKKTIHVLKESFQTSLRDFFLIPKLANLLVFIFTLKIASSVTLTMGAPFFLSLGFSKIEFASITKGYGVSMALLGAYMGGVVSHKQNMLACIRLSILLQILGCFLFSMLSYAEKQEIFLPIIAISIESFSSGMMAVGYISYLSLFAKKPHVSSHFTLLYSVGSLSRIASSILAGFLCVRYGWQFLFLATATTSIPALYYTRNINLGNIALTKTL
jgi:PAT family beta-lactamase induction signal transducer AmpG